MSTNTQDIALQIEINGEILKFNYYKLSLNISHVCHILAFFFYAKNAIRILGLETI